MDILHILKDNTSGRPNKLPTNYLDAGILNHSITIKGIWDTLGKWYVSDKHVSSTLSNDKGQINMFQAL